MLPLGTLLLVLLLLFQVRGEEQRFSVELELGPNTEHAQHELQLTVSVINNSSLGDRRFVRYDPSTLRCTQGDTEDTVSRDLKQPSQKDQRLGQLVMYYFFDVFVEEAGFVRCSASGGAQTITSNVVFFRPDTFVYILQINTFKSRNLSDKDKQTLQKQLGGAQKYLVSGSTSTTIRLTAGNRYVATRDLQQLRELRSRVDTDVKGRVPFEVVDVRSTQLCAPYDGEHVRLMATDLQVTAVYNTTLTWPDGTPLTVRCLGDFYSGRYWSTEDISAIEKFAASRRPTMTEDTTNNTLTPLRVQALVEQLSREELSGKDVPRVVQTVNQLLSNGSMALRQLQRQQLNTSNEILAALDHALASTRELGERGFVQSVLPNYAARVEEAGVTGSVGVALLEQQDLVKLTTNTSQQQITDWEPRAAVRLPTSLVQSEGRLSVSMFASGALFSEVPTSTVLSATLGSRHHDHLLEPVKLWFRRDLSISPEPGQCMWWDFSLHAGRGGWSPQGCLLHAVHPARDNVTLDECWCWHLTHFGEIFLHVSTNVTSPPDKDTRRNNEVLDLITQVGCAVSLAGLCGVFSTALFAPDWLRGPGQKIQLQISLSLALLLLAFLASSQLDVTASAMRVLLGTLLHYSLLSNFCWMLLAAFLQYTRLVKVVRSRSSRLPLKSGLIGWALPLLPPLAILLSGHYEEYTLPPLYLPRGLIFYLSIALPLALVMLCNLTVFVLIAHNLYVNISIRRHDNHCLSLRRFKQLVFLFSLLGLAWLLGLAQMAFPPPWQLLFSYLFCLSVAAQGLTHFLFFIVMDEGAQQAWRLRFCPSSAKYDVKRYTCRSRIASSSLSHGATENSTTIANKPM